ncbi:MAG: transketolase [Clostridia bacterium]
MKVKNSFLAEKARNFQKTILEITHHAGMGHVGGSLSEVDILTVLYFSVMRVDPSNPTWEDRDRFIISKGHASPGYYTVLSARGYFSPEQLKTFDEADSMLQAHPDMHKCPGVDYSTGSLGQGLSIGIGIALGGAKRGKNFKTFVLVGDGECQEGQVWEALMYAGANKVKNLVVVIDNNKVQLSSSMKDNVNIDPLPQKIAAFNWKVVEVDGHDIDTLEETLRAAAADSDVGPVAVIAHTVKGKGVSFMENKYEWHGKAPNAAQLAEAIAELEGGSEV